MACMERSRAASISGSGGHPSRPEGRDAGAETRVGAMANRNGDTLRWNLLNWPTLLLFVLLSWGIVLIPPPLRSTRPRGKPRQSPDRVADNRFESRLWQDPFDFLFPAAQKIKGCPPLPNQKEALFDDKRYEGRVLILPVLLPGENYPEDVENRLRSRYSVVSALGVSGYIPDEEGDLRCFQMDLGLKEP